MAFLCPDLGCWIRCVQDSLETEEGGDARVIQCLQDYKEELTVQECKDQVHKLTERAAQDVRFDEPLADACAEDRKTYCEDVQPVGSWVEFVFSLKTDCPIRTIVRTDGTDGENGRNGPFPMENGNRLLFGANPGSCFWLILLSG